MSRSSNKKLLNDTTTRELIYYVFMRNKQEVLYSLEMLPWSAIYQSLSDEWDDASFRIRNKYILKTARKLSKYQKEYDKFKNKYEYKYYLQHLPKWIQKANSFVIFFE